MSDLVERLRRRWPRPQEGALGDLHEAADRIEQLERELDTANGLWLFWNDKAAELARILSVERGQAFELVSRIDDERRQAFEEAAEIIRARMPLYTEPQALNACRECISSIEGAKAKAHSETRQEQSNG